ncbi:hypothetical protein CSAL01_03691 [Colletotrichum salicis]|uniref:Uncharacterized protein n=1 Tax=Colletotrichum salicis TaxID=1209931 RepID=A0A135V2M7_9PEZI|nr:hypothetical protein CSAL01_03691 [Colletotrichum salicis]
MIARVSADLDLDSAHNVALHRISLLPKPPRFFSPLFIMRIDLRPSPSSAASSSSTQDLKSTIVICIDFEGVNPTKNGALADKEVIDFAFEENGKHLVDQDVVYSATVEVRC